MKQPSAHHLLFRLLSALGTAGGGALVVPGAPGFVRDAVRLMLDGGPLPSGCDVWAIGDALRSIEEGGERGRARKISEALAEAAKVPGKVGRPKMSEAQVLAANPRVVEMLDAGAKVSTIVSDLGISTEKVCRIRKILRSRREEMAAAA